MLLATIPTAYVFVLSERRAAAVALVAGFLVFALVLFFRRRKAFFVVVPVVLVLATAYSAAFWNATEGVGFGARAVKTVIAPDDVSERDASSDIYRDIENYNLVYTIRAEPLTGVGFGKPFYQPAQLPDSQLLRLLPVHPAQLGPVDLAEDGVRRLRGVAVHHRRRASSGHPRLATAAVGRRLGGHRRRALPSS